MTRGRRDGKRTAIIGAMLGKMPFGITIDRIAFALILGMTLASTPFRRTKAAVA